MKFLNKWLVYPLLVIALLSQIPYQFSQCTYQLSWSPYYYFFNTICLFKFKYFIFNSDISFLIQIFKFSLDTFEVCIDRKLYISKIIQLFQLKKADSVKKIVTLSETLPVELETLPIESGTLPVESDFLPVEKIHLLFESYHLQVDPELL